MKYMSDAVKDQKPFVQRMIEEQSELNERLTKLYKFTDSETYKKLTFLQKHYIKAQIRIMLKYFKILDKRINLEALV